MPTPSITTYRKNKIAARYPLKERTLIEDVSHSRIRNLNPPLPYPGFQGIIVKASYHIPRATEQMWDEQQSRQKFRHISEPALSKRLFDHIDNRIFSIKRRRPKQLKNPSQFKEFW